MVNKTVYSLRCAVIRITSCYTAYLFVIASVLQDILSNLPYTTICLCKLQVIIFTCITLLVYRLYKDILLQAVIQASISLIHTITDAILMAHA